MKTTVDNLARIKAGVTVQCRNCGHFGTPKIELLRELVGQFGDIMRIKWRCTICQSRRVMIGIGHESATPQLQHRIPFMAGD